ncbi:MAG TPA: hypothetical protein VHP58_00125 [Alphaproteobacteria bacterium]|nr:hypothetical protein [Alphaproteobacteria bacterium]
METAVIIIVAAAMVYLKAFRYMALVLIFGIGAYQASLFTKVTMQPHLIIALALATLVGTLIIQMLGHKSTKQ